MPSVRIVSPVGPERASDVRRVFADAWWADARTVADIERMLDSGCITVGAVTETGELVGFGRAITDGVYKAVLLDIVVIEEYRGAGIGSRIVETLLADSAVAAAEDVELYCKQSLTRFYAPFGFEVPPDTLFLRRRRRG